METNTPNYLRDQYKDSSKLDIRIRFHERYSTPKMDWHEWVFEQLNIGEDKNIVEFGCGSGALWQKNLSRLKESWNLTLTDLSEGMLVKARQAVGERSNVKYCLMDIQSTTFEDDSVDAVIANHMLYHVPDISRALAEVRRILRLNGTFYATANGTKHISEIYEYAAAFDPTLPFSKPLNSVYFGLENGERQLKAHFGQVELIRFESRLEVADACDLAEYMFSVGPDLKHSLVASGRESAFLTFLESKRNSKGFIPITKDSGIFICRK